jgi:hypothetical protein
MTTRKRPLPNIVGTLRTLHSELVSRAEQEKRAGFEGETPTLDQTPSDAALTYLCAHNADGSFCVTIPPNSSVTVTLNPSIPDPEKATLALADGLLRLATYEQTKQQENRWRRCLALAKELRGALIDAQQDGAAAGPDVLWRTGILGGPLAADAIPCLTACGALAMRLELFFGTAEAPLAELAEQDLAAFAKMRRTLMCVFKDREIASLIDDGFGGTHRDRTERLRKQRNAAKNGADEHTWRFPQEGLPNLVISSETI